MYICAISFAFSTLITSESIVSQKYDSFLWFITFFKLFWLAGDWTKWSVSGGYLTILKRNFEGDDEDDHGCSDHKCRQPPWIEWSVITHITVHRRNLNVDDDGDGGDHHHHDHKDVGDHPRVVSGYLTVHRRQLPGPATTVPMSPLQIIPVFFCIVFFLDRPKTNCDIKYCNIL